MLGLGMMMAALPALWLDGQVRQRRELEARRGEDEDAGPQDTPPAAE
ncbi:MAG: hypothetical protein R3F33_05960 [Planctomycetota bacterium]